ncbi:MAG: hypothetical protein ACM65M_14790 [Microcoleus sp.]
MVSDIEEVGTRGTVTLQDALALDIEDPEGWSSFLENYGWYWPA